MCNKDCFNCIYSDCIRDEQQDERDRAKAYYAACKDEISIKRRERYKRNEEKEKAYRREYHAKHKDDQEYIKKNREKCKAYRDSHLEERRRKDREYYRANREKRLEYQREYRRRNEEH